MLSSPERPEWLDRCPEGLAVLFLICSNLCAMRIDHTAVAATLLTCPHRLRVGLNAASKREQDVAANELADLILAEIGIDEGTTAPDPNQLPLAL